MPAASSTSSPSPVVDEGMELLTGLPAESPTRTVSDPRAGQRQGGPAAGTARRQMERSPTGKSDREGSSPEQEVVPLLFVGIVCAVGVLSLWKAPGLHAPATADADTANRRDYPPLPRIATARPHQKPMPGRGHTPTTCRTGFGRLREVLPLPPAGQGLTRLRLRRREGVQGTPRRRSPG